jgi:hypothetical protein
LRLAYFVAPIFQFGLSDLDSAKVLHEAVKVSPRRRNGDESEHCSNHCSHEATPNHKREKRIFGML